MISHKALSKTPSSKGKKKSQEAPQQPAKIEKFKKPEQVKSVQSISVQSIIEDIMLESDYPIDTFNVFFVDHLEKLNKIISNELLKIIVNKILYSEDNLDDSKSDNWNTIDSYLNNDQDPLVQNLDRIIQKQVQYTTYLEWGNAAFELSSDYLGQLKPIKDEYTDFCLSLISLAGFTEDIDIHDIQFIAEEICGNYYLENNFPLLVVIQILKSPHHSLLSANFSKLHFLFTDITKLNQIDFILNHLGGETADINTKKTLILKYKDKSMDLLRLLLENGYFSEMILDSFFNIYKGIINEPTLAILHFLFHSINALNIDQKNNFIKVFLNSKQKLKINNTDMESFLLSGFILDAFMAEDFLVCLPYDAPRFRNWILMLNYLLAGGYKCTIGQTPYVLLPGGEKTEESVITVNFKSFNGQFVAHFHPDVTEKDLKKSYNASNFHLKIDRYIKLVDNQVKPGQLGTDKVFSAIN